MSITVQKLYDTVSSMELTLVAGEGGLSNHVTWTHTVENLRIAEFLIGGEVVFTTGMTLDQTVPLLELVRQIQQKNASAMVINTGPYIQSIPEEVLLFAQENNFPLFKAPWHVHMADINRIICLSILQHGKTNLDHQVVFQNAMLSAGSANNYCDILEEKGFSSDWRYQITVAEGDSIPQDFYLLRRKIEQMLKHCIVFLYSGRMYLILYRMSDNDTSNPLPEVFTATQAQCPSVRLSSGPWVALNRLHRSYGIASRICLLQPSCSRLLSYENLESYKLILNIKDDSVLYEYIAESIGPLIEHDAMTKSSPLLEVLKSYLHSNGSVLKTAEQLFVHRNTINYQLKKIEELLGKNLSNLEVRANLLMAVLAQDIVLQHENN